MGPCSDRHGMYWFELNFGIFEIGFYNIDPFLKILSGKFNR